MNIVHCSQATTRQQRLTASQLEKSLKGYNSAFVPVLCYSVAFDASSGLFTKGEYAPASFSLRSFLSLK